MTKTQESKVKRNRIKEEKEPGKEINKERKLRTKLTVRVIIISKNKYLIKEMK
jgi:hypothetical protein